MRSMGRADGCTCGWQLTMDDDDTIARMIGKGALGRLVLQWKQAVAVACDQFEFKISEV